MTSTGCGDATKMICDIFSKKSDDKELINTVRDMTYHEIDAAMALLHCAISTERPVVYPRLQETAAEPAIRPRADEAEYPAFENLTKQYISSLKREGLTALLTRANLHGQCERNVSVKDMRQSLLHYVSSLQSSVRVPEAMVVETNNPVFEAIDSSPEHADSWNRIMADWRGGGLQRGILVDVPHVMELAQHEQHWHALLDTVNARFKNPTNFNRVHNSKTLRYQYIRNRGDRDTLFQALIETVNPLLRVSPMCREDPDISVRWSPSLMYNACGTHKQQAHLDYSEVLLRQGKKILRENIGKDVLVSSKEYYKKYNLYMPFLGFLPVTEAGMYLLVWPDKETLDMYTSDVIPTLIHIRLGELLVVRGDTVHAGGIDDDYGCSTGSGCPRVHFYLHKDCRDRKKAMAEPVEQNNYYMRFDD